jgi:hypothetical protein
MTDRSKLKNKEHKIVSDDETLKDIESLDWGMLWLEFLL